MATATAIEIKRAQEAERQANILAEINERLQRIESMCEKALAILENPMAVLDTPVTPKRVGRPISQGN